MIKLTFEGTQEEFVALAIHIAHAQISIANEHGHKEDINPYNQKLLREDVLLLMDSLMKRNKIEAIKAVRSMLKLTLKEAKDLVEAHGHWE